MNYAAGLVSQHADTMGSKFDLIIFDFDGTLADSGAWFAGVFNEVAVRFGFRTLSHDGLQALRGQPTREILRSLAIPMWKMPLIASYMRRKVATDFQSIPTFPGVDALLRQLHQTRKKIAIVSSNSEANIRGILGAENAATISHFGCGAGLFGKARLLRRAMKHSGTRPAATLCIGDETRDIDAARSVGAFAAAVTWGYATPEILRSWKPDIVFESMQEIMRHVDRTSSSSDASE